jgi:hypothetical protein
MSYNKHLMDKPDAMKRVTVALLDGTVYQGSLDFFEYIVNLVLLAQLPLDFILALACLDLVEYGVDDGDLEFDFFKHGLLICLSQVNQNLAQVKCRQGLHFHGMKNLVLYLPHVLKVVGLSMVGDLEILRGTIVLVESLHRGL